MNHQVFKNKKQELIGILLFSIIYIFGTLILTGTLFSGYHLVDDHEIVRRGYYFEKDNWALSAKILGGFPWINLRFRPLYDFLRRVRIVVLGDNFLAWYILVGMEIVLSMAVAYFIARLFKCSNMMAALFAMLIVTGEQSAIWWRLGPQEPTGLLLFLLGILFVQFFEMTCEKRWMAAAVLAAVLSSWAKESFTLSVAAIPMLAVAYDMMLQRKPAFWHSVKKNLFVILTVGIIICLDLYVIVSQVTVLSIGYAGIDTEFGITGYIINMAELLGKNLFPYVILLAVGAAFLIAKAITGEKGKEKKCLNIPVLFVSIAALYIMGTQMFLYAKSGISERYLVPFTVGAGILGVITANFFLREKKKFIRTYGSVIALFVLYLWISKVYPAGRDFAAMGKDVEDCFDTIVSCAQKEDVIVSALDSERNLSVETWLELEEGFLYVFSYSREEGIVQRISENDYLISDIMEADYIISNETYEGYETIKTWSFASLLKKSK